MRELWKPVPYEPFSSAYSVSNLGRVKPNTPSRYSKNRAEVLTPAPSPRGYLHVSLYAAGKQRSAFVHRMVAIAFHGAPPFPGAQVRHLDDCRTNNAAANLRWGTPAENCADRDRNGLGQQGQKNGRAKLSEHDVRAIRAEYAAGRTSQQRIAGRYGVKQTAISRIVLGVSWKHVS